jgi:hypothetical protein
MPPEGQALVQNHSEPEKQECDKPAIHASNDSSGSDYTCFCLSPCFTTGSTLGRIVLPSATMVSPKLAAGRIGPAIKSGSGRPNRRPTAHPREARRSCRCGGSGGSARRNGTSKKAGKCDAERAPPACFSAALTSGFGPAIGMPRAATQDTNSWTRSRLPTPSSSSMATR